MPLLISMKTVYIYIYIYKYTKECFILCAVLLLFVDKSALTDVYLHAQLERFTVEVMQNVMINAFSTSLLFSLMYVV